MVRHIFPILVLLALGCNDKDDAARRSFAPPAFTAPPPPRSTEERCAATCGARGIQSWGEALGQATCACQTCAPEPALPLPRGCLPNDAGIFCLVPASGKMRTP